ncbi:XRE family transcriptional regulator [Kocuria indica]|uniref:XRE family transcriptional regulator n=1 Tax=Kocuria marina subsp. indica TaxID=1049583 RepID=A0A6N9R1F0_9MICC|nr:XRE family transcriptional regulator [Kocuria indica]NDO78471.1 XRE family transcriptional regulator [Kocuria indica]
MAERFVSTTEAPALLGVTRDALYKRDDWPEPDALIGKIRGWREETLLAWNELYRPRA